MRSGADRASDGGDVLYSKLNHDTAGLKVTKFPGAVGVEIANQMAKRSRLAECRRLIVDLRGNESGASHSCASQAIHPDRRTIGYSVTRQGAERASMDTLKTFGWIPSGKLGLPWLAGEVRFLGPSVRVATEGLGAYPFHGRMVLLVDVRPPALASVLPRSPPMNTWLLSRRQDRGQVICSDSNRLGTISL